MLRIAFLFLLIGSGRTVAQEYWFSPAPFTYVLRDANNVPLTGQDADGMRDDWLANVTHAAAWPTGYNQAFVFKSFLNILPPAALTGLGQTELRMTDVELSSLTAFLNTNSFKQAFETGGIRLSSLNNGTNAGEGQAAVEIPWLQRWMTNGGSLDYITTDHAVLMNWVYQYDQTNYPYAMTLGDLTTELVDYFAAIHAAFPNTKLGIIEGPAGFQVTTPWGFVFAPNKGNIPAVEFSGFLDDLLQKMSLCGLSLDHYHIDHGPHAVSSDTNQTGSANWEFGRLIAVEKACAARGVRFGVLMHPGRDFTIPVSGTTDLEMNRKAYQTMIRYLNEYRAAGGQADDILSSTWQYYPRITGPETTPYSVMNITRDQWLLDELLQGRHVIKYFDDPFTNNASVWQKGATWSVTNGVLLQANAADFCSAEIPGTEFSGVIIETSLKLGTNSGWAGVQFRKTAVNDRPWNSGYLVQVYKNGTITLYKAGTGTIQSVSSGLDFATKPVDLRIEAVGSSIRVYADGIKQIHQPDSSFVCGYVSLSTLGTVAEYDDFSIQQVLLPVESFVDDFSSGTISSAWAAVGGIWSVSSGAVTQSGATGCAQLVLTNQMVSSAECSVNVKLGSGNGWAGLLLRKNSVAGLPWNEGYLVAVKPDGTVFLYKTGTVLKQYSSGLSFTTEPAQLCVRTVGHKIQVWLNGGLVIEYYDETFAEGWLSLVSFSQAAEFDDVGLKEEF